MLSPAIKKETCQPNTQSHICHSFRKNKKMVMSIRYLHVNLNKISMWYVKTYQLGPKVLILPTNNTLHLLDKFYLLINTYTEISTRSLGENHCTYLKWPMFQESGSQEGHLPLYSAIKVTLKGESRGRDISVPGRTV